MNSLVKTELEAICDEAKKIEHVTNCTAEYRGDDQIWIVVESFLANDDGSSVERGRGLVILTTAQFTGKAWIHPFLLLSSFRRAIEADGCEFAGWIANPVEPGMDRMQDNIEILARVLGEAPAWYHGVAFALIVAGIVVSSRR